MAFHELATNAAKYGALSAPGGRVEIRWQAAPQGDDGRPWLHIDWREQGGPAVNEPQQRGFGSKLIEGSIAAELHGRPALQFKREGLRCEFFVLLETAAFETDNRSGAGADWSI